MSGESMGLWLLVEISSRLFQAEMDKTKADLEKHEWDALRANLQQQIQVLSDRVIAFENQYSGVSFNQAELDANGTAAEDIATLRHRVRIELDPRWGIRLRICAR